MKMKKYLTSIVAMDNKEGKLAKFVGPVIEAESFEAAIAWCQQHAKYLFVEQELITYQTTDKLVCAN
jgi:hypothetical protein